MDELEVQICKKNFILMSHVYLCIFRACDMAHLHQVLDICVCGPVPRDGRPGGCYIQVHLHGPLLVLRPHIPGRSKVNYCRSKGHLYNN